MDITENPGNALYKSAYRFSLCLPQTPGMNAMCKSNLRSSIWREEKVFVDLKSRRNLFQLELFVMGGGASRSMLTPVTVLERGAEPPHEAKGLEHKRSQPSEPRLTELKTRNSDLDRELESTVREELETLKSDRDVLAVELPAKIKQAELDQRLESEVQRYDPLATQQIDNEGHRLSEEVRSLKSEKQQLSSCIQQLEEAHERCNNEKKQLSAIVQQLEEDHRQCNDQKQQLEARNQKLEEDCRRSDNEKQHLEARIQQLEEAHGRCSDEKQQLEEGHSGRCDDEKRRREARNEQLEEDSSQSDDEKQQLAAVIRQLEDSKNKNLEMQVQASQKGSLAHDANHAIMPPPNYEELGACLICCAMLLLDA
ncbi:hypothetical protein CYMTET_48282 [Cymbomonas tetramitiformis]|uniref:Uncharacterized protein n=1 Tax=Cymbomonas tetramitiformis TaxID=36881 RepID=A0AAE0EV58_9CHLO|nr:hypothetical protein CYMTET_48282 [Cymbomonas tetramitiformis]